MKSFRSIVFEENEDMAADIPATANDTELKTGDPLNAVDGTGAAPLSTGEAEGIENAADSVAADIVDGKDTGSVDAGANGEEVAPEDAPVASVDAEDEPVASVDAPHEEPDGDEGPNPTAPSDNDGDEETPDVPEVAAKQATESCVIVQCGLIALNSAMKINEAASTEAFLGARTTYDKRIVVEGFVDTIKGAWNKLIEFLVKIKNGIINFIKKVITYIRTLFARVYANLNKKLHGDKAKTNWGRSAGKAKIKVKPLIKKNGLAAVEKGSAFTISVDTKKDLAAIKQAKRVDSMIQGYNIAIRDARAEFKTFTDSEDVEIAVSSLFPTYNAAAAYIKDGYSSAIDKASTECKGIVTSCNTLIAELKSAKPEEKTPKAEKDKVKDNNPTPISTASTKVRLVNMISSMVIFRTNANTKILIKCLKYAGAAIKAVANDDYHVEESYIDNDILSFLNA